ncbi:MAG TPA: YmdB family metallophosphoesterase, partial [Candidatus Cloacimonadota bacterium]|nr:YmdB family metallophosphoesterase [Candidatus Cloacimonadota bacterium]
SEARIVKPMNYPLAAPGHRVCRIERNDMALSVISFTGQIFMPPCDSPFTAFENFYNMQGESPEPLLIDFHAESTAEKRAFGWFVDGKASAILGTHTHIQTADEEILPQGTAYITDVGMTGPHDSVIGVRKQIILEKNRNAVPIRFETSDTGMQVNAVLVDIDALNGFARRIQRIRRNVEII